MTQDCGTKDSIPRFGKRPSRTTPSLVRTGGVKLGRQAENPCANAVPTCESGVDCSGQKACIKAIAWRSSLQSGMGSLGFKRVPSSIDESTELSTLTICFVTPMAMYRANDRIEEDDVSGWFASVLVG